MPLSEENTTLPPEAPGQEEPLSTGTWTMRVLYCFAGPPRWCDLRCALEASLQELRGPVMEEFGCNIELFMLEVDTLRQGHDQDMTRTELQQRFIEEIDAGDWDVAVATPPCNGHSRLLWNSRRGPKPVRSRMHLRGFPWNSKSCKERAEASNTLIDFSLNAVRAALRRNHEEYWRKTRHLVEFPEDLGDAVLGPPASLWQEPVVPELLEAGSRTGVFYQCHVAPVSYSKPTRVLSDIPLLVDDTFEGMPEFEETYFDK